MTAPGTENHCRHCGKSSLKPERCPYCGEPYAAPAPEEPEAMVSVSISERLLDDVQRDIVVRLRNALGDVVDEMPESHDNMHARLLVAMLSESAHLAVSLKTDAISWTVMAADIFGRVEEGLRRRAQQQLGEALSAAVQSIKDSTGEEPRVVSTVDHEGSDSPLRRVRRGGPVVRRTARRPIRRA